MAGCIAATLCLPRAGAVTSELVDYDSTSGALRYNNDATGNRIPDFSFAGYKSGSPLPTWFIRSNSTTLAANDSSDQTATIQAAIDACGSLPMQADGYRGKVVLGPGIFRVDRTIKLNTSGVVLSGSVDASGNPATILHRNKTASKANGDLVDLIDTAGSPTVATSAQEASVIIIGNVADSTSTSNPQGSGDAFGSFWDATKNNGAGMVSTNFVYDPPAQTFITDSRLNLGDTSLNITSADRTARNYQVGDRIVISPTLNDAWFTAVDHGGMSAAPEDDQPYWGKPGNTDNGALAVRYYREITNISAPDASGNVRITFDAPIFSNFDSTTSPVFIYRSNLLPDSRNGYQGTASLATAANKPKSLIENCGIENIFVDIDYTKDANGDLATFSGPGSWHYETHCNDAIKFSSVENCWARNSGAQHFVHAGITVNNDSVRCTIENCSSVDPMAETTGERKYNFNSYRAQFVLFKDCYSRAGRHSFTANGAGADSGIVYRDCHVDQAKEGCEPHMAWTSGVLYDNLTGTTDLDFYNQGLWGGKSTGLNPVANSSRNISADTVSGGVRTITTSAAHTLVSNDLVTVAGHTPASVNGIHKVTFVSSTKFSFPDSDTTAGTATGTVTEGNYPTAGTTGNGIGHGWTGVNCVAWHCDLLGETPKAGSTRNISSSSASGGVRTFVTSTAHTYAVNDAVKISGHSLSNHTYQVKTVAADGLSFTVSDANTGSGSGGTVSEVSIDAKKRMHVQKPPTAQNFAIGCKAYIVMANVMRPHWSFQLSPDGYKEFGLWAEGNFGPGFEPQDANGAYILNTRILQDFDFIRPNAGIGYVEPRGGDGNGTDRDTAYADQIARLNAGTATAAVSKSFMSSMAQDDFYDQLEPQSLYDAQYALREVFVEAEALPWTTGKNDGTTVSGLASSVIDDVSPYVFSGANGTHQAAAVNFTSPAVPGQFVEYTVPNVRAGTYNVYIRTKKYYTRGKFRLDVGGNPGSGTYGVSGYSQVGDVMDFSWPGTAAAYQEICVGTWTCGTTSAKRFRFSVDSAGGSGGSAFVLDYIRLQATSVRESVVEETNAPYAKSAAPYSNWSEPDAIGGSCGVLNATVDGDFATYEISGLTGGKTYNVVIRTKQGANRAITKIYKQVTAADVTNNVKTQIGNVGGYDLYGANVFADLPPFTYAVGGTGAQTRYLRFEVSGKNAASTGRQVWIDSIQFNEQ